MACTFSSSIGQADVPKIEPPSFERAIKALTGNMVPQASRFFVTHDGQAIS